jgi:hypothetical protein
MRVHRWPGGIQTFVYFKAIDKKIERRGKTTVYFFNYVATSLYNLSFSSLTPALYSPILISTGFQKSSSGEFDISRIEKGIHRKLRHLVEVCREQAASSTATPGS